MKPWPIARPDGVRALNQNAEAVAGCRRGLASRNSLEESP